MTMKFGLFLWKNFKYVSSNWISTFILTVACCALIIGYEALTHYTIQSENWIYEPKAEIDLQQEFNLQNGDVICYSPDTPELEKFMSKIRELFEIPYNGIIPYKTADEMYEFLNGKTQTRSFGIAFHNFPNGSSANPSNLLNYTISTTHGTISLNQVYLNDKRPVRRRDYDDYTSSGFFILQRVIDKNFILMSGRDHPFELEVSPFPKRAIEEYHSEKVFYFGIIFLLITYVYLLATMLIPLVEEKDDGIKEFISLGTQYRFVNEVTFVIVRLFLYILIVGIAIFAGYYWESLTPINIGVMIVFLSLYVISLMCYTLLISICFQSVFFAKVGGILLYLIHFGFYSIENRLVVDFTCISNGKSFLEGIKTFTSFIDKDRQFSLDDINTTVLSDTWPIAHIFIWLSFQSILYTSLYFYLSMVFPGRGGIPEKFYFMFQPSFWKKNKNFNPNNWNSSKHAIQVRKLRKVYKCGFNRTKVAVDGVDLNIQKNNITVLLGHNGAGKTTTLNMIVGLLPKTSGEIQVPEASGKSEYRHLIGYCPQHSIFMKYLTCEEHLQFFGQLKGLDPSDAANEANILLSKLRLDTKAKEQGKNLSGGMKRKLSLGIAISGRTKIVVLDEPSSGLDPESRRELWDILLCIRKSQAVLVTTHFMEEAEVLGDTVAIMSHGSLVCCDSIPNLKREYGSGYVLKLLLDGQNDSRILNFVQKYIETACEKSFVSPTLSISLPYESKEKYSELLSALESSKMDLKIKTISVTNTTLEDVFLNCEKPTEDMTDSFIKETNHSYQMLEINTNDKNLRSDKIHYFWAVLYKKLKYLQREWMYVLFMFLIPVVTVVLSYLAMSSVNLADVMQSKLTFSVNHLQENRIYLKISSEFNQFRSYLEMEIGHANATAVMINEDISVNDYLLQLQEKNLNDFYDNILGAIEVIPDDGQHLIRIYYSGNAIHSSSIMLNLVDDALAKLAKGENAHIQTSNMPIKKSLIVSRGRLECFAHIMPLGFFLYILFYVSLPFKEKKTEFKKLQNMPPVVYWFSSYTFDIVLHFLFCWIIFGLQCAIDTHNIYTVSEKTWITMLLIFYGIGYMPLLYIVATSFNTMSGLSTTLFTVVLISSISPLITSSNIQSMSDYEGLIYLFSFMPDFSLKHQLHIVNENYFVSRRNNLVKPGKDENVATFSHTYKTEQLVSHTPAYFIILIVALVLEIIYLIIISDNIQRREKLSESLSLTRCKRGTSEEMCIDTSNEDVRKEEQFVENIVADTKTGYYSLVVRNLQKYYGKTRAVRGISFAVKPGECFGLLGLNGAGKTSTFQMITGNRRITAGEVYIRGYDCSSNEYLYKAQFGYCPQVDALNKFMTGREILIYFGLLLGMSFADACHDASYWIAQLDLQKYENVPVREYSGGTKRKLNIAIAMIGEPSVIFLDEPTTGVDPKSRRFIWECIQNKQKQNTTIILTSHSMDECEFLCNRLAIMARGKLKCIGFIPHLKDTLGKGCTFTFKMKESIKYNRRLELEGEVDKRFQNALKSEEHGEFVTYSLQNQKVVWSNIFKTLHSLYTEFHDVIDDYNVNETTLEDVFLKCESQ